MHVSADGVESPTVVLDSASLSDHEPTVSPDPFRDVIKTEPAPDLPSLIGDMMIPYFVEQQQQQQQQHSVTTPTGSGGSKFGGDDFGLASSLHNDSRNDVEAARPSSTESTHRNLVSQHNAGNFSAYDVTITSTAVNPIIDDGDDSIFSLDSVLDLFFNEAPPKLNGAAAFKVTNFSAPSTTTTTTTSTTLPPPTTTTTTTTAKPRTTTATTTTTTTRKRIAASTTTRTRTTTTTTTTKKSPEKESPVGASGGLLKLAGCNIYGRMYSVGRIITELSGACLECRCTELGVQCEPLDC